MIRLLAIGSLPALALTLLSFSLSKTVSSKIETTADLPRVQQQPSPSPTPRIDNGSLPLVSPDGSRIAFTSNRSGASDLYIIDADGSNERQLTHTPEGEGNLEWTANSKILFSIFKNETSRLYAIDADGKNQRELTSVPGRAPTLSPDGKRILYMAGTWTATRLMVAAADGSNAKQITDGSSIAWNNHWSPNGKLIAFTGREKPKSELAVFVMNVDGSHRRQLTHGPAEEGGAQWPVWSPDGRRLAIQVNSRTQNNSAHIWTVDAATGAAQKLAPHTERYLDETPSWFPDGKRIAFQSNRTGRMEVWVMNVDGTQQRQVTGVPPVTLGGDPRVSPDGLRIAFISNRSGAYQLYVMNADGSGVRQLTNGSTGSFLGNWSRDSRRIVSYSGSNGRIMTTNRDGSGSRVISEMEGDQLPSFSSDDSKILFAAGTFPNINIYTMNLNGSDRRNVSPNPGFDYDPAWSPDGKSIALVTAVRGQGPRVWVMNADGTNRRRVTNSNDAEERPAWSRDGRYLAFQSAKRGSGPRDAYIHVVEVPTGTDRRLGNHDQPYLDEILRGFPMADASRFKATAAGALRFGQ